MLFKHVTNMSKEEFEDLKERWEKKENECNASEYSNTKLKSKNKILKESSIGFFTMGLMVGYFMSIAVSIWLDFISK